MRSATLIQLLATPDQVSQLADAEWHDIVEQGRKSQVLGQLAASLTRKHLMEFVPVAVRRHLELATQVAVRRVESAMWEIQTIRRVMDPAVPLVLLKGGAYATSGDVNSAGRTFSDIDVLVRRPRLSDMESALFAAGWKPSRVNDYDAAYYRNWMHEVPPMEHVRRHTVVDLHHAINPPVSRFFIDPVKLFETVVEVQPGIFVLSPVDRVIHCAMHLLQEGEPKKLMRDLYDLHMLLDQHFSSVAGREPLRARARELHVDQLVRIASSAADVMFGRDPIDDRSTGWLRNCLLRSGREANGDLSIRGQFAGSAVLAHSHWMKMPVRLLVPHLLRKSYLRMTTGKESTS